MNAPALLTPHEWVWRTGHIYMNWDGAKGDFYVVVKTGQVHDEVHFDLRSYPTYDEAMAAVEKLLVKHAAELLG